MGDDYTGGMGWDNSGTGPQLLHSTLDELFRIVELLDHQRDVHSRPAWKAFAAAIHPVLTDQRERVGQQIERDGKPPARASHHRLVVLESVPMFVEHRHGIRVFVKQELQREL